MGIVKKCRKRILLVTLIIGLIMMAGTSLLVSQPEFAVATQGEFAVRLVEALGMQALLSETGHTKESIALLKNLGITPPGGFEAEKKLDKKDIAVLMVKAKNLEGELVDEVRASQKKGFIEVEKAVLMKFEGEVLFDKGTQDGWQPVTPGMELFQGDSVRTGEGSYADLKIGTFGGIRIQESTEIVLRELTTRMDKKTGDVVIFIAQGEVLSKTAHLPKGSSYTTISPTIAAAVRGTVPNHKVTPEGDVITSAESQVIAWLVNALGEPVGDRIIIGEGKTVTGTPQGFGAVQDADSELLAKMRRAAQELLNEMNEIERHWAWLMLQQWTRDNVEAAERLLKKKGIDTSNGASALNSIGAGDGENKMGNAWSKKKDSSSDDPDTDLPDLAMGGGNANTGSSNTPPFIQEPPGATNGGIGGKGSNSGGNYTTTGGYSGSSGFPTDDLPPSLSSGPFGDDDI